MSKDLDIQTSPSIPDSPPRPSDAYLRGSNKPGPAPTKKLLVLDLNGTLVHRVLKPDSSSSSSEASSGHGHPQESSASSSSSTSSSSSSSTASCSASLSTRPHKDIPPSTRTSHPRPYIPTLLAYLFHPHTKSWLTTIAWSSSKPSSVVEMVETCFGEEYVGHLGAVWSREQEEEGLPEEDRKGGKNGKNGKKKRKAVKDLGRIWGSPGSPPMPSSSLFPSTHCPSSPLHHSHLLEAHSQASTILLDDTPSKAAHQPFNYVPVAKYTKEALVRDYAMFGKVVVAGKEDEEDEGDGSPGSTEPSSPTSASANPAPLAEAGAGDEGSGGTPVLPPPALAADHSTSLDGEEADDDEGPDPTLLAVIGILSALKEVPNVSYWIKRGGLTRTCPPPPPTSSASSAAGGCSAGNNAPWYTLPHVMAYWVKRGREEVGRLGIEVRVYADAGADIRGVGVGERVGQGKNVVGDEEGEEEIEGGVSTPSPKRVDQLRQPHPTRHRERPQPVKRGSSSASASSAVTVTPKPVGVVVLAA